MATGGVTCFAMSHYQEARFAGQVQSIQPSKSTSGSYTEGFGIILLFLKIMMFVCVLAAIGVYLTSDSGYFDSDGGFEF